MSIPLFASADRPLVLAVGNDRQFAALVGELGAPGLSDDRRFVTNTERVAHREALAATLTGRLATDTTDGWSARLRY